MKRVLALPTAALLFAILACALPGSGPYLEPFDTDIDWATGQDDLSEAGVEDGRMVIRVLESNYISWTWTDHVVEADAVIEVEAAQIGGPDENAYGLLIRVDEDATQFYYFEVTGDGLVDIGYCMEDCDSADTLIGGFVESDAVLQGAATNRLKVVTAGTKMSFYVNDVLIREVTDDRIATSGTIGLIAESFDEAGVEVAFDNLKAEETAP